jgi:hypothetical protein
MLCAVSAVVEPNLSTTGIAQRACCAFSWRQMLRLSTCLVTLGFAATLAACSGKTERGGSGAGGDAAPVQKPAAGPSNAEPTRDAAARHLLLVVELELATHVARTLTARSVDVPLPRRRGPAQRAPWRVDVLAQDGSVLFSAPQEDTATVRGEFPDAKGQLSGVTVQKRVAAVTLRLPWLDGASEVRVVSVGDGTETELGRVAYPQVAP